MDRLTDQECDELAMMATIRNRIIRLFRVRSIAAWSIPSAHDPNDYRGRAVLGMEVLDCNEASGEIERT